MRPDGVLVGRYRLLELVGRGGAAEVWRAEDRELDRQVAVKVLYGAAVGDDLVDRGRAEGRSAARLVHPNVVAVYDFGIADDRPFIVMELVDGPSLAYLLKSVPARQWRRVEVASVALQSARALEAAHDAGIVHRDVKPGNLLLASDGTVKLADFGIATAELLTCAWPLLGTAAYISPEQIRGEPATAASDWYALGCVLYELLTGAPPFTAPQTELVLKLHVYAEPTPLAKLRPELDPDVGEFIGCLLDKDPVRRPTSLRAIETAFRDPTSSTRSSVELCTQSRTQEFSGIARPVGIQ